MRRLWLGSLCTGVTAAAVGAAYFGHSSGNNNMGCSSNTPAAGSSSSSSGGGSSGGGPGDGGEPLIDGSMGPCTAQTHMTVATKISVNVAWPSTLAVAGDMGPLSISLLSNYDVDSAGHITGTTKTCQNQTPPITLAMSADQVLGIPAGSKVQIVIGPSTWGAPKMPTTNITGQIGGWNIGSSIKIDPAVALDGLLPSSMYADPKTAWPDDMTMTEPIPLTDTRADDGNLWGSGITAIPKSDNGFYTPQTALSMTAPHVDAIYVILRTELTLYGKSTSCTESSGAATITLLNNHVVGCHHADAAADAGFCDMSEYGYIDSNTTAYCAGKLNGSKCAEPVPGTYQAKQLNVDGGGTCDDVAAALP
jgi:hypothetical protein